MDDLDALGEPVVTTPQGTPARYRIHVRGTLPARWAEWFDGFALSYEANGDTVLTGSFVDQAMLHGAISRVRDLGLTLVAVEPADADALDH